VAWAVGEDLLRSNPLGDMRGPPRPEPRKHYCIAEVRRLLRFAEANVASAHTALTAAPRSLRRQRSLLGAEQGLLLVGLAADSAPVGASFAVLRLADLEGRVLMIERRLSHGVLGSTKSGRKRRLTLDRTTSSLIYNHVDSRQLLCPEPPMGDWLFAPKVTRATYMTAEALSHKFRRLGIAAASPSPRCTGSAMASPPILWTRASR